MREVAERVYFRLCLAMGGLLRAGRYAQTQSEAEVQVRKRRRFYAPLLLWIGGPLMRVLDTGVRILAQRDWEKREHDIYQRLYGKPVRPDTDGSLLLPHIPGETLANLLADRGHEDWVRKRGIELAAVALAELHALGLTHGDAMAENVMIDLHSGVARWFDFETTHDSDRPISWRRADDVRALLTTCLLRTPLRARAEALELVLDAYSDEEIARLVASSFTSVLRRPLTFHLGQAALSLAEFRETARLLKARDGRSQSRSSRSSGHSAPPQPSRVP